MHPTPALKLQQSHQLLQSTTTSAAPAGAANDGQVGGGPVLGAAARGHSAGSLGHLVLGAAAHS